MSITRNEINLILIIKYYGILLIVCRTNLIIYNNHGGYLVKYIYYYLVKLLCYHLNK